MNPVIEISRVTKRFGSHTALSDVSLTVPTGTVFALLGENGAGKTTTIKLLLGLEEADCGSLRVLGLDCRREAEEIRRRVGYVPEQPALYDWMTASEIGWFTAGFYPEPYEQEYRKLLERFRVPLGRKISQMSKGMRAKVSLSLSLAHQPELLILDEPTSGLDTLVRREFLESMVDIAAAGRTVLLSSHQIGEVERVADIVAIVREGELLVVESLDTLKCQIRELTITMSGSRPPELPCDTLSRRQRGRQWQFLVRTLQNTDFDDLSKQPEVVAVETRTPSLEEIFVAYMQSDKREGSNVEEESRNYDPAEVQP
ncbi:ABC transporter ATP-binding protein [Bythopirellula polymerisocia]|uniref:ABC transporter ATP-binding protein YtrB n=1 Tax=Bythopirellula polymerisocia TaxID=2528003 RepID=A0A5C6D3K2_9BACT|nr:ABC transporter ATP-binding protein [Bythopirellula polymerisocia]TWU29439.1 ABC transporter ATP-binding protein YtrB [Bythopirellula polymerisocia]